MRKMYLTAILLAMATGHAFAQEQNPLPNPSVISSDSSSVILSDSSSVISSEVEKSLPAPDKGGWAVLGGFSLFGLDRMATWNSELGYNDDWHWIRGKKLPTVSVSGGYILPGQDCAFFLNLYMDLAYDLLDGGPSPMYEREVIWSLMPEIRTYYSRFRRDNLRLYAFFAAGLRVRHFSETFEGDTLHEYDCRFSWQFSPLCAEFGKNWLFSIDLGAGTAWNFVKLSAGYRF